MLNKIVGKNNFEIILVMPKNVKSYINHLTKRFLEDPENYGRIECMLTLDRDREMIGLNDFFQGLYYW